MWSSFSGHVVHGINSGLVPYLNKEEEKELAIFLKKSASIWYGKTRKQVMAIVEAYTLPITRKVSKVQKLHKGGGGGNFRKTKKLSLKTM